MIDRPRFDGHPVVCYLFKIRFRDVENQIHPHFLFIRNSARPELPLIVSGHDTSSLMSDRRQISGQWYFRQLLSRLV